MMPALSDYPVVPCVPYAVLRPQFRSGDLLLCSGRSDVARLIQEVTDSLWSHVAVLVRPERIDRLLVMESVESIGVRTVSLRSYVEDYNGTGVPYPGRLYVARHAALAGDPPPDLETFLCTAIDVLGYPYDRKDLVRILARIVAARFGYQPPPLQTERAYICSEYAAKCLSALGITIPWDHRGFITPADFAACAEVQMLAEIMT